MAISSVVLRGFGNGTVTGTIPLVVTRGYAIGAAVTAIYGGKFVAGQVYSPGLQAGQSYLPGFKAGEAYQPGFQAGEKF